MSTVLPNHLPAPRARADHDKRRTAFNRLPLVLRRYAQEPRLLLQPKPLAGLIVFALLTLILFFRRSTSPPTHAVLLWGSEPKNWGDHVGLGLGRAKMLAATPPNYAHLGDHFTHIKGELYKGRRAELIDVKAKVVKARNAVTERDRHGTLGGASLEWSSGVVGVGTWLGHAVDMRKLPQAGSLLAEAEKLPAGPVRQALADYILEFGWTFRDEAARLDNEAVREKARALNKWEELLPLKELVRGDEPKMKEAALAWAKMFTAQEGEWKKSALEVALEKTVRSVPVVVFSKTTCPHSKRAKALLAKYKITPAPHIIEVDIRPDAIHLKGLLARRTLHSTFPNIIIGSRSIGGADDLEKLERDGMLTKMIEEATAA